MWSGTRDVEDIIGYKVTVQSPVKDPVYLDERIEEFILNSKVDKECQDTHFSELASQ